MSITENLDDFIKIFSGHPLTYNYGQYPIVREENKTGSKVSNTAIHFAEDSTVLPSLYEGHLKGTQFIGIAPINDENKASYGIIDIDIYGEALTNIVRLIYDNNIPLLPFRTKSGGLHLYLFLRAPVQAKSLVDCLKDIDDTLGLSANFPKKVEIFPKQIKLAAGQNPSPCTLPYYNAAKPSAYLLDTKLKEVLFDDAMKVIKRSRTNLQDVSDALKALPFSDAPKCLQTMRLGSWIRKDGGRNKYLYSVCVFLKKKHNGAEKIIHDELSEYNQSMIEPVDDEELETIFQSIMTHEYNYKCQDEPCKTFCNAAKCRTRQFGVGKEKNAVFTGLEYGPMTRYLTADPYYEWQLKLADDQGEFKRIKFANEYELLDQRKFATLVMRYCNVAPVQIEDNQWRKTLTLYLSELKEEKVAESGDTTETAKLKSEFERYLATNKAVMPAQIKLGLVVETDTKYFFTYQGYADYLDKKKKTNLNIQLRELLIKFGAKEDTMYYENRNGVKTKVECWSKLKDEGTREAGAYYDDVLAAQDAIITKAAEEYEAKKETVTQDTEDEDEEPAF